MSGWTDARDNAKQGLIAMWTAFSPMTKGFFVGFMIGTLTSGILFMLLRFAL